VIPIIEQHHARFSAFEPTTLQHDGSVSTNLPFISMRCLFCACTCLLCKETECRKGVREPHHRGQSLPFRAPDVTRLPSKGGGRARGKPDLSESKLRLHYNKTLSIIGHVGKGCVCPSFSPVCPSSLFPLPQKYILVCNWPLQTLGRHILDQCEPRFVCQKSPAAQHHQDACQGL
jgi:hypothetical protein